MRKSGRVPAVAAALLVAGLACTSAHAQKDYPSKSIRLIVPFAPGGGTDIVARVLAQKLTEAFMQTVIVDNRAGGGGTIGAEIAVRATPDGYTAIIMSGSYATNAAMYKLPYDPVSDILPMGLIGDTAFIVALHPGVPIKSVAELVAYAKAKPGALNYGSSGTGGIAHLSGALFDLLAATKMTHVAYKGTGPALNDLLGGQVQAGILVMGTVRPHIQAGKLRALAVVESTRAKAMPNLPTVGEDIPGYAMPTLWCGIVGPRGLPSAIVSRLNAEIARTLVTPQVAKRLEALGYEVTGSSPEQFAEIMKSTTEAYRRITSAAGIKPQ